MRLINSNFESVCIEFTDLEFNFVREVSLAILVNCDSQNLYESTGFAKDKIIDFTGELVLISETLGIEL